MKGIENIEQYIQQYSSEEHPYLNKLYRATQTKLLYPRMASGHLQGIFLRMLVQTLQPRLVLEIGTYSGYSTLALASGMSSDTKIISYEVNDEQEDFTRPWLEQSPFKAEIDFRIANILEDKSWMNGTYDLIFMDGNKREYIQYYETVLPHLRSGGILLADNTLWDGHVIEKNKGNNLQTQGIIDFNSHVKQDERVEKLILPLRDGISIIRKK